MQIIKRNGNIVPYDENRIIHAIKSAMMDIGEDIEPDIIKKIEKKLSKSIKDSGEHWDVERISDKIEEFLMEYGFHKVAKAYILYRNQRTKLRESGYEKTEGLLSDEFISKYKHLSNPFPSALGEMVFYRTYSRWLSEKNRREYWWETCKRAVEYNCSLVKNVSKEEAENLFDNMYNLKQFLSGRTLYSGGTKVSEDFPMSNFNCSGIVIDCIEAFHETFYMLLLGSGVGFRALPEDVEKLPKFNSKLEVIDKTYIAVPKLKRKEHTELTFASDNVAYITIGDSKTGWVTALKYIMDLYTDSFYKLIQTIVIDYDNIRPFGEQLKTFGGTASGYKAIKDTIEKICKVIENRGIKEDIQYIKLKPIDVLDIETCIAEGVVVGGIRRSSEIGFGDKDDIEFINAKQNLYIKDDNDIWVFNKDIENRQLSNNTIFYKNKPLREELKEHFKKMKISGEPAIINSEEAIRRNPNFKLTNPCGEILLDTKSCCNLTTVNVFGFVENGMLNIENLIYAQILSARAGLRMACIEMELHEWNENLKRDRLIGCSLTGWQDMINATEMSFENQILLLKRLKEEAVNSANRYADELSVNHPQLITTIKPEGSLSQLPTVSSGLHYSHSPYFIRRVRVTSNTPILKVFEELNYPIFPDNGQTEENCTRKVIEFAVKSPNGRTKHDVSALEQLKNYKMFMDYYVQHNASITVHVRDNEWEAVEQWVWDNWDSIIGISFLSLDDNFYKLLPYESITEEEYKIRKSNEKLFNPNILFKYEQSEFKDDDLTDDGCTSGACPTR